MESARRIGNLSSIGPILGDMALQRIGILGFSVALPIANMVLARFFATMTGKLMRRNPNNPLILTNRWSGPGMMAG